MPENEPYDPTQPANLRAIATSDATECTYRYAAISLGVAAALVIVTTVREIDTHAAFGIGLACALGALALAMHSRVLRGQRAIASMLVHNYEYFNARLNLVDEAEAEQLGLFGATVRAARDDLIKRRNGHHV